MESRRRRFGIVIVAHPDDETIWAGGTILMHAEWNWTIISLCRGDDYDRAPRFEQAVRRLGGQGIMGNTDDGTEQLPLPDSEVEQTILQLLAGRKSQIILTHSPFGEYTRHRRHEETGKAVFSLWKRGWIKSQVVWLFAYQDRGTGGRGDLPTPIAGAHRSIELPEDVLQTKYEIITGVYGFDPQSYEAEILPSVEAFWCFGTSWQYEDWLRTQALTSPATAEKEARYEGSGSL